MIEIVSIGVGGFFGAAGRYWLGRTIGKIWLGDFPMPTFAVNMLGSFALGLLMAYPYHTGQLLNSHVHAALTVGFMGSFTTFSTLMYDSFVLVKNDKLWLAALNVILSIVVGLLLAWLAICFLFK